MPVQHTFNWDVIGSGFFGQSDNVVFRLEAYPSLAPLANSAPVFQRPYAAASTFPFRVRGTQVRVFSDTLPVANALVYRLPVTQTLGAAPMSSRDGKPFHTDGQGYLLGHDQLASGDQLLAMAPISQARTPSPEACPLRRG